MRFKDQTIAITGGNSGIGLAAARAFVSQGAKVAIFGRDMDTLEAAKKELGVLAFAGDITSQSSLSDFFESASSELGLLDVLFANAGIAEFLPFEHANQEHFRQLMEVNYLGTVATIKEALPHFSESACVVLTTSIANQLGEPNSSGYAASKAAVRSLARTLSTDLLARGIRVNAVSPGPTETPIFKRMGLTPDQMDDLTTALSSNIPAGRMGQSEDTVNAVLFLAARENSFIVGQELVIDGGIVGCNSLS